jgi:dTDP-4-dehydrorhamnose 3,5-epimerase
VKVETTAIPGVLLVEPSVHGDERGFFLETWHEPRYREAGIAGPFVQDNHSRSSRGILRGLHAQAPHWQGKLVRCVSGEVWDVAVDVRFGSPAFGQHVAVELSERNFKQLWVPPGLLHGFCALSDSAEIEYKCTDLYVAEDDFSVRWDDPELAVPWPIEEPLLSDKDRNAPLLAQVRDRLMRFEGQGSEGGPLPG